MSLDLSVLILARNEQKNIGDCIASVQNIWMQERLSSLMTGVLMTLFPSLKIWGRVSLSTR